MKLSKQLLDQVAHLKSDGPSEDEKRSAPRVGVRVGVELYVESEEGESAAVPVTVRDISAAGISLVHREAIPRGTVFAMRLPRRDGKMVALCCTVKHCRRVADRVYSIGAEFTRFAA